MWAAFPTSQWIQLKIGLLDESGCGLNAANIGWKNARTVVVTPSKAWVWLGPDTHSPSSIKMQADPANDRIQVNIINNRCHCYNKINKTINRSSNVLESKGGIEPVGYVGLKDIKPIIYIYIIYIFYRLFYSYSY